MEAPQVERGREKGQTMSEYALVLAVITPAIVAAFALLSESFVDRIETVVGFFS
jgi:Flp pilus assembly pilin Flp